MQNPIQKLINKLFEETSFEDIFKDEFKIKLKTLLEYNDLIKNLYNNENINIPHIQTYPCKKNPNEDYPIITY